MRTKTVKRHYCDHCNRGGFNRSLMERHERTCFRNPYRRCPLCGDKPEHEVRPYCEILAPVQTVGPECPYCLLAVIIQGNTGQDHQEMTYYSKEQLQQDVDSFRKEYLYPHMWFEERLNVPPPFRIPPYVEFVKEPS